MKRLSTLHTLDLANGDILPADKFEMVCVSNNLVSWTQIWSQQRREALETEVEEALDEARATGLREGLEALRDLQEDLKAQQAVAKSQVQAIVWACLKRVFDDVPKAILFETILDDVCAAVQLDGNLTILCHPADVEILEAALAALIARPAHPLAQLEVTIDVGDGIEPRACEIHTSRTIVTSGAAVLLEQIVDAISPDVAPALDQLEGQSAPHLEINSPSNSRQSFQSGDTT